MMCGVRVKHGRFCSLACYTKSCEDSGAPLRQGTRDGCENVSVPGLPSGSKCSTCYKDHLNTSKDKARRDGHACSNLGCLVLVQQLRPKYGEYCSLQCGLASGKGSCCVDCGNMCAFRRSNDAQRCQECVNAKAAEDKRKRAARKRKWADGDGAGGLGQAAAAAGGSRGWGPRRAKKLRREGGREGREGR